MIIVILMMVPTIAQSLRYALSLSSAPPPVMGLFLSPQGAGGDSEDDDPGGIMEQAAVISGSQFMSMLSDTQVMGDGVFPDSQEPIPLTGSNLIPMPRKVKHMYAVCSCKCTCSHATSSGGSVLLCYPILVWRASPFATRKGLV